MRTELRVSTIVDKPALLRNLVEKLDFHSPDYTYKNAETLKEWKTLKCSSAESVVHGLNVLDVAAGDEQNRFRMPFNTSFFFTCMKILSGDYKIAWSTSLS